MHARSSDRLILGVVDGQDGVASRTQLLAAGMTRHEIQGHLHRGLLSPALHGIYVMGSAPLSRRQFLRCALLHAGADSLLAERTAAEQRGLLRPEAGRAVVVAPPSTVKRQTWTRRKLDTGGLGVIVVRSTTTKLPRDLADGLPATPVARSLVDLAAAQPEQVVRWAWSEAEFRGLLDIGALRRELDGLARPGTRVVRRLLAAHDAVTTPSTRLIGRDELPFLKLLARAGIPAPAVNVSMMIGDQRYVADFLWVKEGLVVELDDPGHLRPAARDRDVLRDVEFFNAGLDVLRFMTTRVSAEPDRCMALLRTALERKSS